MDTHAIRLTELIAVIDEMAGTFKPESLPGWLNDAVPAERNAISPAHARR
jgi:hypothetical protein